MQLCFLHAKTKWKCHVWQPNPNKASASYWVPLWCLSESTPQRRNSKHCPWLSLLPAVSSPVRLSERNGGSKAAEDRNKERERKKIPNHLLDIVKTSRFRFQYGSMMKHFIESDPKEDDIKLQLGGWGWGRKKQGLCDIAQHDGEKAHLFSVTDALL